MNRHTDKKTIQHTKQFQNIHCSQKSVLGVPQAKNPKCQSGISSKIIKFLDPHKQKDMKNGQARIGY